MRRSTFHEEEDYVLRMGESRRQLRSRRRFISGISRFQAGTDVTAYQVRQSKSAKTSAAFKQHVTSAKRRLEMRNGIHTGES